MTGAEMKAAAIALFGERGWQKALVEALAISRTSIWRYAKSDSVPGPVKAAIEGWQAMDRAVSGA